MTTHDNSRRSVNVLIMAAKGKAIIFYRFNIDERPAMGSQPNLASRSEMVLI